MNIVYTHANVADLAFLTEMLGSFHGELDKQTGRCRLADRALHLLLGCEPPSPLQFEERENPLPNWHRSLTEMIDQRITTNEKLQVGVEYDLKAWDHNGTRSDGEALTCFE
jgi:hypothetical protein